MPEVSGGHGGGCQVSSIAVWIVVDSEVTQHRGEAGGEAEEWRHDDEKEEEKVMASGESNDGGDGGVRSVRIVSGCELQACRDPSEAEEMRSGDPQLSSVDCGVWRWTTESGLLLRTWDNLVWINDSMEK